MYYPDISHWKPVTDWNKAKANCALLISKGTQGTSYVDPTLDSFIKGCENKGIPYWLYTFLDKGNELGQAQFLVKTCKPKVGKMFVGYVLDVEAGNAAGDVRKALDYIKTQSAKTMLYTMYSEYNRYKGIISERGSSCAWWEARYGQNNGSYSSKYPAHDGCDLHQYTSKGSCPGITAGCDLNRLTGTKPESWFRTAGAAKEPAAKPVKASPAGSTLDLAIATLQGKYGNGQARKTALGSRYSEVQTLINYVNTAPIRELAQAVIAGKFGNGEQRKAILGSKYAAVQNYVNKIMQ